MDRTTLNVTASNLPKNLFEDPLWTFLYWLLFFFFYRRTNPRKNFHLPCQAIRFRLRPSGLHTSTPTLMLHLTQSRPDVGAAALISARHIWRQCPAVWRFFRLCITWNFKGQAACKRHRRLCAAENKDSRESSQS